MSKKYVKDVKEIEAIINEWNEDDDTTDCSDCEVPLSPYPQNKENISKNHDKENISMDSKTNISITLEPKNMDFRPINITLKPVSDNYLPISCNDNPSESEALHLGQCILISKTTNSDLISNARHAIGPEKCIGNLPIVSGCEGGGILISEHTDSDIISLPRVQKPPGVDKNIDNLPITSECDENGILISQNTNPDFINLSEAQQVTGPDQATGLKNTFDNITDISEGKGGIVLINESVDLILVNTLDAQPANAPEKPSTSYTNQTIENLPVYAEDGILILSTISQAHQKTCEHAIEPENTFENLSYNSKGESDNILLNKSGNSGLVSISNAQQAIASEETSINQIEAPEQTSGNGTEITKRGGIRKRKHKTANKAEVKKKKLEELAEKHKVLESCDSNTCKMKCGTKITEDRRVEINKQYWMLAWLERRSFILNSCERFEVNRRTTKKDNTVRNNTFKYYFKNTEGVDQGVCKSFFLTTLGYKKSNDRVLHDVLSKTPKGNLQPDSDKRGKQSSANKISDVEFMEHVETFQPTISHYRREHAPNVRYLPSDITISIMYNDFVTKYSTVKMSYETYRQKLKKMNISFTRLGHEECSACEVLKLHEHDKDNLKEDCETCTIWKSHHEKYTKSRALYRRHAENAPKNSPATHFSADLEKVIMLPRAEGFKEVIFAKRLTVYNECFVPVGEKSSTPAFAAVWHEGIAGRCKEELISTFYAFLVTQRDNKSVAIWLDNCSSQNKNWCFLSFLVFIINSDIINCETIMIHYFEPGHTYMSADSFHHQIELSLKRMGKVYDFNDFIQAVHGANKGRVNVKSMTYTDFQIWKDFTSANKLKEKDRPLLADIVNILATRGDYTLKYKKTYEETEEYKTLNFLKASSMKKGGMTFPAVKQRADGFSKTKKENILHVLKNILPDNRKVFWRDLPEAVEDENKNKTAKKQRKK